MMEEKKTLHLNGVPQRRTIIQLKITQTLSQSKTSISALSKMIQVLILQSFGLPTDKYKQSDNRDLNND